MKTENIKIRLMVDLTKYNPMLVKGIEGVTFPQTSAIFDCDTDCCFNGVTIRIANSGFEVIDEEYLAQVTEFKKQSYNEHLSATSVVKKYGKRGGFDGLSITYTSKGGYTVSRNIRNRNEAKNIEQFLRDAGKPIEEKRD